MDSIQQCAEIYRGLTSSIVRVTLENDQVLEIIFSSENFKHLIGLHKLTDIRSISDMPAKMAFKSALKGEISKKAINSKRYHLIQKRIMYFPLITALLSSKVIIDFDTSLVPGGTELSNTDYMFYRIIPDGVVHLTITEGFKGFHPESFFFDPSKKYISDQQLLDIVSVELIPK